tara:strand:+ start:1680 stop:2282 length:603 start_codon:yes stop_codon:yes gene_type:complete
MPTLDDIPTLDTLAAVHPNDSLVVSDNTASGRGGSKIRRIPAVLATNGFTHAWRFDFDSASVAVGSTGSGAIDLLALTDNMFVSKVGVMVGADFDGGSINSYTVKVGYTGDDDRYIENMEMAVDGSEVHYRINTGDAIDGPFAAGGAGEQQTGDELTASKTLIATFTASHNLDTATAGSCVILANIIAPSDVASLVPKFD